MTTSRYRLLGNTAERPSSESFVSSVTTFLSGGTFFKRRAERSHPSNRRWLSAYILHTTGDARRVLQLSQPLKPQSTRSRGEKIHHEIITDGLYRPNARKSLLHDRMWRPQVYLKCFGSPEQVKNASPMANAIVTSHFSVTSLSFVTMLLEKIRMITAQEASKRGTHPVNTRESSVANWR